MATAPPSPPTAPPRHRLRRRGLRLHPDRRLRRRRDDRLHPRDRPETPPKPPPSPPAPSPSPPPPKARRLPRRVLRRDRPSHQGHHLHRPTDQPPRPQRHHRSRPRRRRRQGFAVVANEVKELAKETARATEDIGRKIEAIQGDTTGAVTAIAEISEVIGRINDIQTTIASAVEGQTATTNEIAAPSPKPPAAPTASPTTSPKSPPPPTTPATAPTTPSSPPPPGHHGHRDSKPSWPASRSEGLTWRRPPSSPRPSPSTSGSSPQALERAVPEAFRLWAFW